MPVFIQLDERPASASLATVHSVQSTRGLRYFGPYLGGVRVRLAVTALSRILPVGYTGTRLSGSEAEMARLLGIDPSDRERLVRSLAGVLDRAPDDVARARKALEERRDDAASTLDFEYAGRLQAELRAVEWVVCEQKATSMAPADLDVHGWADGTLLRLEIRAGRLCGWSHRTCSAGTADAGG